MRQSEKEKEGGEMRREMRRGLRGSRPHFELRDLIATMPINTDLLH